MKDPTRIVAIAIGADIVCPNSRLKITDLSLTHFRPARAVGYDGGMRSRKDSWFNRNPDSKRYINTCVVCGAKGYAPQVDDPDFADAKYTPHRDFSRRMMKSQLRKYYKPLSLDAAGRCAGCAGSER